MKPEVRHPPPDVKLRGSVTFMGNTFHLILILLKTFVFLFKRFFFVVLLLITYICAEDKKIQRLTIACHSIRVLVNNATRPKQDTWQPGKLPESSGNNSLSLSTDKCCLFAWCEKNWFTATYPYLFYISSRGMQRHFEILFMTIHFTVTLPWYVRAGWAIK